MIGCTFISRILDENQTHRACFDVEKKVPQITLGLGFSRELQMHLSTAFHWNCSREYQINIDCFYKLFM